MKGWLTKKVESLAGRVGYETEKLLLEINEQIVRRMQDLKLSRSALAEKLGKDRAQITRLLNGNANTTVKTLVEIANALGTRWNVELQDVHPKRTSVNRNFFEVADWLAYIPASLPTTNSWAPLEETWRHYSAASHWRTSRNIVSSSPSKNILVKPEFREVVN
jgi:transcriptional regulator with XRE-family HTH domain